METHNPNLRMTNSVLDEVLNCVKQTLHEKSGQRLHSHKECSDYLSYFIQTATPDQIGYPNWARIAPDYSLLAATEISDGPNDFDTGLNALQLGALELAVSMIENLSMVIAWEDRCGRERRDTLIARLLLENQ